MGDYLYPLGLSEPEKEMLFVPDYYSGRYRMDYSVHEIKTYLNFVGSAIREKSFLVLKEDPDDPTCTRAKNSDFMRIYGLWDSRAQASLLLGISESEFCHTMRCNDGRVLYVFCIDRVLYKVASGDENVRVYVKHDFDPSGRIKDLIVSLHKLELPILRAFES